MLFFKVTIAVAVTALLSAIAGVVLYLSDQSGPWLGLVAFGAVLGVLGLVAFRMEEHLFFHSRAHLSYNQGVSYEWVKGASEDELDPDDRRTWPKAVLMAHLRDGTGRVGFVYDLGETHSGMFTVNRGPKDTMYVVEGSDTLEWLEKASPESVPGIPHL